MCAKPVGTLLFVSLTVCGFAGSPAFAQLEPWDLFLDTESSSVCDVVNAENTELVVLSDTGQLVIVTGPDVLLEDTFVDADGDVYIGNDPVGFIDFAEDGDGYRTLWWLSLTGNVVHVDGFSGNPTETNYLPSDFFDVPCDACPLWDDPTVCAGSVVPDEPTVPSISFNLCGFGAPAAMAMTAIGLVATGRVRRRWT